VWSRTEPKGFVDQVQDWAIGVRCYSLGPNSFVVGMKAGAELEDGQIRAIFDFGESFRGVTREEISAKEDWAECFINEVFVKNVVLAAVGDDELEQVLTIVLLEEITSFFLCEAKFGRG
jgi:hypothetical protein